MSVEDLHVSIVVRDRASDMRHAVASANGQNGIRAEAEAELAQTLVSVVIPVYDRIDLAVSAFHSAAAQSHKRVEIIVVDDGAREDLAPIEHAIARSTVPARLIRQPNRGPAAARNAGWRTASGAYVAFLDADDLLLPDKVTVQLAAMAKAGAALSHTSYFRHWIQSTDFVRMASGAGNSFPDIIGSCGIATPTVMVRRDLWDDGTRFPEDIRFGEDVVLWLRIAKRHGVLGIDRALTIVRASEASAAYDRDKQITGLDNILAAIDADPDLVRHAKERDRLVDTRKRLAAGKGERDTASWLHRVARRIPLLRAARHAARRIRGGCADASAEIQHRDRATAEQLLAGAGEREGQSGAGEAAVTKSSFEPAGAVRADGGATAQLPSPSTRMGQPAFLSSGDQAKSSARIRSTFTGQPEQVR